MFLVKNGCIKKTQKIGNPGPLPPPYSGIFPKFYQSFFVGFPNMTIRLTALLGVVGLLLLLLPDVVLDLQPWRRVLRIGKIVA